MKNETLLPVEDVVFHLEKGEAFLLNLGSGQYFSLNQSGTVAWNAIVTGDDPVQRLSAARPDVSLEEHAADWAALRGELLQAGLLRETHDL